MPYWPPAEMLCLLLHLGFQQPWVPQKHQAQHWYVPSYSFIWSCTRFTYNKSPPLFFSPLFAGASGAVIQIPSQDGGRPKNIVIDVCRYDNTTYDNALTPLFDTGQCGKTFYNGEHYELKISTKDAWNWHSSTGGSITLWPELGIREIDALVLTHVHSVSDPSCSHETCSLRN